MLSFYGILCIQSWTKVLLSLKISKNGFILSAKITSNLRYRSPLQKRFRDFSQRGSVFGFYWDWTLKLHTLRYSNPLSFILEDFFSIRFKPHQVVSRIDKVNKHFKNRKTVKNRKKCKNIAIQGYSHAFLNKKLFRIAHF